MKITYLIRNDEVKNQFVGKKLPKGVACDVVGTYEAEGGRLFLLSFTVDGSTIAGARKLAKLLGISRKGAQHPRQVLRSLSFCQFPTYIVRKDKTLRKVARQDQQPPAWIRLQGGR